MCHLAEGSNPAVVYASLCVPLDHKTEHLGEGRYAEKLGGSGRGGVAMEQTPRSKPSGYLRGPLAGNVCPEMSTLRQTP